MIGRKRLLQGLTVFALAGIAGLYSPAAGWAANEQEGEMDAESGSCAVCTNSCGWMGPKCLLHCGDFQPGMSCTYTPDACVGASGTRYSYRLYCGVA